MTLDTVNELIDLWPKRADLADEISHYLGDRARPLSAARVHKWAANGSIPAKYHGAVIAVAAARGFDVVTADLLVALHAQARDAA